MKQKRSLIYGTNAFIFTLIVLGILVAVNYVLYKRGGARYDVTEGGLHSLSTQTVRVLDTLESDIEMFAFFKQVGVDRGEFQDLIKEYQKRTKRIKVRYVDPDKEPGMSKKYGVNEYGTIVLTKGEQNTKLNLEDLISGGIVEDAEEQLTNAIIKLSSEIRKTVYFLSGHGERDINDKTKPEGYGLLATAIRNESYQVKDMLLVREATIPPKDSVLIIAGPKKPLIDSEIQAIKKYITAGGKAIFMIEPRSGDDLVSLLTNYGFSIKNDIVIDPSSKLVGGGDITPIIADYTMHDITDRFSFATIFPYTRSIDAIEKDGVDTTVIANTSEYSWAESNFELFDQGIAQKDPDDKPGPVGVFAVSEIGEKTKVAVFGSADFASNRFIDFSGNNDFFLNTLNWVLGDEHLISIRPKTGKVGEFTVTGRQMKIIFALTLIVFPAIVLFAGVATWWKRRNM